MKEPLTVEPFSTEFRTTLLMSMELMIMVFSFVELMTVELITVTFMRRDPMMVELVAIELERVESLIELSSTWLLFTIVEERTEDLFTVLNWTSEPETFDWVIVDLSSLVFETLLSALVEKVITTLSFVEFMTILLMRVAFRRMD